MSDFAWVIGSEVSESFMGLVHRCAELSKEQGLRLHAVLVSENLTDSETGLLKASGADKVLYIPLSDADVNSESAAVACLEKLAGEEEPVFILFESSAFFCSVAPMLAARFKCGLFVVCIELSWSGDRLLRLT